MKRIRLISRSRPSSEAVRACLLAAAFVFAPLGAGAQDLQKIEIQSPILVIDQDRLFSETQLGTEALRALEARERTLATENQTIETELIERERELTELRPTMTPDEFRGLADEFDTRVETIREEQDEKARELTRAREDARQDFFQNVAGIISEIVREKGAVAVIDRRAVFLSANSIDITDEAIRRVNATDE
ncbi:MAG: OmpH family outer membrane protein [Silicimonas sp.]|nr:OmpH family outer membrane protein [Silicimonas sp.]